MNIKVGDWVEITDKVSEDKYFTGDSGKVFAGKIGRVEHIIIGDYDSASIRLEYIILDFSTSSLRKISKEEFESKPRRYNTIPKIADAVRFNGENADEVLRLCARGKITKGHRIEGDLLFVKDRIFPFVLKNGDWLVKEANVIRIMSDEDLHKEFEAI